MTPRFVALAALAFLLAACGPPSTADALKKAEGVKTRTELESRLGKPTEIAKLGPIENWTYKTSDGSVSFVITGDTVQMSSGGTNSK